MVFNLTLISIYSVHYVHDYISCQGHCHKLSVERGLNHARLPISEFIQISSRKVLTINHGKDYILLSNNNLQLLE